MNNNYWKNFYKKEEAPIDPSSFAIFCKKYIGKKDVVLDLGCGNGRDTKFLSKHSKLAIGIDFGIDDYRTEEDNFVFISKDFKETDIFRSNNITAYYARFFFHAIPDEDIRLILDTVNKEALLMVECRAKEDIPVLYTDHERNLIDYKWILKELEEKNFEIIYKEKNKGLAIYKNEDPCVIRVIARKK